VCDLFSIVLIRSDLFCLIYYVLSGLVWFGIFFLLRSCLIKSAWYDLVCIVCSIRLIRFYRFDQISSSLVRSGLVHLICFFRTICSCLIVLILVLVWSNLVCLDRSILVWSDQVWFYLACIIYSIRNITLSDSTRSCLSYLICSSVGYVVWDGFFSSDYSVLF